MNARPYKLYKPCKPYCSNKHNKANNDIVLNENVELILKNKEIGDTFNNHFGSIVDNLNLQHWNESSDMPSLGVRSKDLNYVINKYRNHPSIKTKKENFPKVYFTISVYRGSQEGNKRLKN